MKEILIVLFAHITQDGKVLIIKQMKTFHQIEIIKAGRLKENTNIVLNKEIFWAD